MVKSRMVSLFSGKLSSVQCHTLGHMLLQQIFSTECMRAVLAEVLLFLMLVVPTYQLVEIFDVYIKF